MKSMVRRWLVGVTVVAVALHALTACSSTSMNAESDDSLSAVELTGAVDEEVTTTTTPPTSTTRPARVVAEELAYESCKTWREAELKMGDVIFGAYPYVNEADANLMMMLMASRAREQMEEASRFDPKFGVIVRSIKKYIQVLWVEWQVSQGNRKRGTVDSSIGTRFFNLCTGFGIWPSSPGKFPPIDREPMRPEQTPLNGARRICQQVFYPSPDGVVYDGSDSFTLTECDGIAAEIALSADSYSDAWASMRDQVFGWRDSWCWGTSCTSRYGLMG